MAPLPRWSDPLFRLTLAFLAVVVVAVPGLLMAWVRTPGHRNVGQPLNQPIQFDHRHHVRDDAIDCIYCHHDVRNGPTAGVPDTALCMSCHAQIWNDSPQTAPLRESWELNRPIMWLRVTDLPDFVFFDHSIHVNRGVGCETCHGRVDLLASVSKQHVIDMGWCLSCHRDPIPYLRPPELATQMNYHNRREEGERIARELDIHPPTNCTACHR